MGEREPARTGARDEYGKGPLRAVVRPFGMRLASGRYPPED